MIVLIDIKNKLLFYTYAQITYTV